MKPSADFLIDRRVVDRHIDKGIVAREDFEKRLAGLPDASENVATTSIPIVKVTARKSAPVKPAVQALPLEDSMYDIDDDDDGDDD